MKFLSWLPAALLCASALSAQDVAGARAKVDSARADLRRYCKTSKPVGYVCPIDTLRLSRASSALTPLVADTGAFATIRGLVGPTIPVTSTPAAFKFYEDSFRTEAKIQWDAFGPAWNAGNSISAYERGATYYAWWMRTGDTTYRNHAHQLVVNYRDGYLIPANYSTSPHWSQAESLYLDCLIANDKASCDAVGKVADVLNAFTYGYITNVANPDMDHRIQARVMVALWMAERLAGKGSVYSPRLDSAITQTLSTLGPDGYANLTGTCGGSLNYMGGMLYDVLDRIHDQRPGSYNAAIEAKTKAFYSFLWSTQWRADKSFNYLSVNCTTAFPGSPNGVGGPSSAPDLNGLILPGFGWLGKLTGDTTWFTRGDQVLAGIQNASVYLLRQNSETYSSSFRYLGYRYVP